MASRSCCVLLAMFCACKATCMRSGLCGVTCIAAQLLREEVAAKLNQFDVLCKRQLRCWLASGKSLMAVDRLSAEERFRSAFEDVLDAEQRGRRIDRSPVLCFPAIVFAVHR